MHITRVFAGRTNKRSVRILVLFLFFVASITTAFGQETDQPDIAIIPYELGDQSFAVQVGLFFPITFISDQGPQPTNLSLGGSGTLRWNAHVGPNLSFGIEASGAVSVSPNGAVLFMLPITGLASYHLRTIGFGTEIEFPISLGVGMNVARLRDDTKIDPIIKPSVGMLFSVDNDWDIGVTASYWLVPQIYFLERLVPDNRLGNFLQVDFTVRYRFDL